MRKTSDRITRETKNNAIPIQLPTPSQSKQYKKWIVILEFVEHKESGALRNFRSRNAVFLGMGNRG